MLVGRSLQEGKAQTSRAKRTTGLMDRLRQLNACVSAACQPYECVGVLHDSSAVCAQDDMEQVQHRSEAFGPSQDKSATVLLYL